MNVTGIFIIGINLVMASPLWADPAEPSGDRYSQDSAHLKKHARRLERMQADRRVDDEHRRQAQEEFRKGTAELSGDDEQQLRDVQDLRSAENQVTAGQIQKTLAHQSYKEAVQQYGSNDSRSAAARESWKQSRQAMRPLLQSRRELKRDVQHGCLLVRNDKTVLGVQKRAMNSDARYRAVSDRHIQNEEKTIADDRRTMTENNQSSEPP
jgi:hypothetical protein